MSDPMLMSLFTIGKIDFSKTVFSIQISHLLSAQLSIGIAKKQALLIHFCDSIFDVMRSVIPLTRSLHSYLRITKEETQSLIQH